jgi:FkbM family methyltransferase
MSFIKAGGRKLLTPFIGRRRYHNFFELLYEVGLAGMNFGEGSNHYSSGELYAMKYIQSEFEKELQPLVIFDVGANVGRYTQDLYQLFSEHANLYAFEPSPRTFKILKNNLRSLKNVRLYNLGFGSEKGIFSLYIQEAGSSVASLYELDPGSEKAHCSEESVQLSTIDEFCSQQGIARIHFLKLDVEGYEFQILKGAQSMLSRDSIDFIQFEFSRWNIESKIFFRDFYYFLKEKYYIYRLLKDALKPIDEYKLTYEIFKRSTNYLAKRKNLEKNVESKA